MQSLHICDHQGYREDSGLTLKSDTDEQLLIHIPFNTAVKISKILFSNAHSTDQVCDISVDNALDGRSCTHLRESHFVRLCPYSPFDPPSRSPPLCPRPQAPRHVKLFINRPTIGFSEAADLPGDLSVELTKENLAGAAVQLKCVPSLGLRREGVDSVTLVGERAHGRHG